MNRILKWYSPTDFKLNIHNNKLIYIYIHYPYVDTLIGITLYKWLSPILIPFNDLF